MVGICRGYTTFPAFSLQALDLLRSSATMRASFDVLLTVVLCILAVTAGHLIAAHFNSGAKAIAQINIEE